MTRKLSGLVPAAALLLAITGVGLGLVVAGSDAASGQHTPPPGGRSAGLPPEALAACDGLAADDSCPITAPDGQALTGICTPTPDQALACMPQGAPPPPPRD